MNQHSHHISDEDALCIRVTPSINTVIRNILADGPCDLTTMREAIARVTHRSLDDVDAAIRERQS